jgi:ribosomal protein L40E
LAFKICAKCGEKCPARIRKCKKCDSAFAFKVRKKKPRSVQVQDWRDLKSGDLIKVSGGPVWIGGDGNETPMGYSGFYLVKELDSNGILACGTHNSSGFCHIWMQGEKLSDIGILKRPHKISKMKTE